MGIKVYKFPALLINGGYYRLDRRTRTSGKFYIRRVWNEEELSAEEKNYLTNF